MDMRRLVGRNFARIRHAQRLTQEQVEDLAAELEQMAGQLAGLVEQTEAVAP